MVGGFRTIMSGILRKPQRCLSQSQRITHDKYHLIRNAIVLVGGMLLPAAQLYCLLSSPDVNEALQYTSSVDHSEPSIA